MELNTPISSLPGIGSYYTYKLKKNGVETVRDLIFHIPSRYQDFSLITPISSLQPGERVTIQGQIIQIKNLYLRNGKKIQEAIVSDGEEEIQVTWFNQPYLIKSLPAGTQVSLSGKVETYGRKKKLVAPEWEKMTPTASSRTRSGNYTNIGMDSGSPAGMTDRLSTIHTGRLVPIYPETEGLSSKWLRNKIATLLPLTIDQVEDPLPQDVLIKHKLLPLAQSLTLSHFPKDLDDADNARHRLAFDELFELQLKSIVRKIQWKEKKVAQPFKIDKEKVLAFIDSLPFQLTESQKRAGREILRDLTRDIPMNRLLEGDVGSGKTVVAALACFVAYTNGCKSAIMAPTQILATQHFHTLSTLLKPYSIGVELLTGTHKPTATRQPPRAILVGTHVLLHTKLNTENLGLVIIDEQHRFGVKQRATLSTPTTSARGRPASGRHPHTLTMTATPIPRTVALAAYGDLDLSTLDELPKGRIPIKTWVVPPKKREAAYKWIRERVKNTEEQAFIVCPLIEESEKEGFKTVKAATVEFERLKTRVFPDLKLELLHGKIKGKDKDAIMEKMKKGQIDILVATPVVEVGIDMPNATIMMIEASERFGLAQLHQLRGRVGRGDKQSYCLLFTESYSPQVFRRLKSLEKTLSGRQLAELDLELRGPGEIYGTAQHGFPELKVASFSDYELIKEAREVAEELVEKIDSHEQLKKLVEKIEVVAPN